MNLAHGVARLRIVVFGCLCSIGVVGFCLTQLNGIGLNTPIVRSTLCYVLGALSLSALLWLPSIHGLKGAASERRRVWYRLGADALALVSVKYLAPLVITVASYGVVPHGLTLADEWLSWPERMLGVTHPVVYRTCEAWGLLPAMELVYGSLWPQLTIMLVWFALVRRSFVPLWEVTAAVSVAGGVGLVVFWLAPAIGPWSHYGYAAYGYSAPPLEAAFLAEFLALREGRLTAIDAAQGLITIPSFHVVFAVLFAWAFRRERWVYPVAVALNAGVIAATFPVGWHYLTDLAGGGVLAACAIAVVRRIQQEPARHASSADVGSVAGPQGVRRYTGKWRVATLGSRESV
jgi:hypothetical protein